MTSLNVPNSLVNGQIADATEVQANFDAIETHANTELINRDGGVAMVGELLLSSNPTSNLAASTKQYVDQEVGNEESARITAVTAEATARADADTALDTRVTTLEEKDITVTFGTGSDLEGSFTITNLGNVTNTTVSVRDDSHNHVTTNIDGFVEAVKDAVGAMVSGNTESGITVTYQTADRTLDFNVADPTITLSGVVSGSATMTNLQDVSITTSYPMGAKAPDSDKLDGVDSSGFLRSDTSDTFTSGTLTFSSGTKMTLARSGGNSIDIKNSASHRSGASMIHFETGGNDQDIRCGHAYIGAPGGGYGDCEVAGSVKVGGLVVHSSSRTIKNSIEDFDGATQTIGALRPVTFAYNKMPEMGTQIGLIAEEVELVDPRLVVDSDVPSLNMNSVIGLLVAGLQEANARISALEAQVAALQG